MKRRKYKFKRWFAHWCAFQAVALRLQVWTPGMLLHDLDKPVLNLFLSNETVKKFHCRHSSHHLGYKGKLNIVEMIIDWECSGITKPESPMKARETLRVIFKDRISEDLYKEIVEHLDYLNL